MEEFKEYIHDLLVKVGFIKPNKMYRRLKDIYTYFQELTMDELNTCSRITYKHYGKFLFKSNNGEAKVSLIWHYPRKFIMQYTREDLIFDMTVTEKDIYLEKTPPLDVEKAVIEIENHLLSNLGTVNDVLDKKAKAAKEYKEQLEMLK